NYHTQGGLRPQPEQPGSLVIHMMPRSDGIALGGTSQRDVWTLEPDEAERRRGVESHMEVFNTMRSARVYLRFEPQPLSNTVAFECGSRSDVENFLLLSMA